LLRLAPDVLRFTAGGRPLRSTSTTVDVDPQSNNVNFRFTFPAAGGEELAVRSTLIGRLAPGHRQYVSVQDAGGRLRAEQLLRAGADSLEIDSRPATADDPIPPTSFWGFAGLGINHILTGYDHLLFLCALLLVARNLASSLKIISCFTLGHSITLALATLDLVHLAPRLVEPLIAASIVYVGIENLLRRGEPTGRYLLTFSFGLVHGLGFATVLREMGVGAHGSGVLVPLLGFNVGVELGQIGVAAVVLPIFWKLGDHPVWLTRWVPACSQLVALAGAWWLVERVAGFGLN
ncbi:MAG: HupE/UreJ family protein, partial [Terrimicrobiaceae bacterium]|nr:HupE/UreJ family protein [Terrimicrobiaceae bacterium]